MNEKTRMERLGRELRRHRNEYGSIQQGELEKELGLANGTLSRVEKGKRFPTPEHLKQHINFFKDDLSARETKYLWQLHSGEIEDISVPLQRPPRAEYFTGRKKELDWLTKNLEPGKVVTLVGPGGVGKTALSAEAVWTLAPNDDPPERFRDGVIFYSFYGQPETELALLHIKNSSGEETGGGTLRDAAQRALARQVLLILDGAEDADNLQAVLDICGNCGVLVSSRTHKGTTTKCLDITPLSIDDAITLLKAWGKEWAADEASVRRICELVGGLPLAVRLVGHYLVEAEQNTVEYLAWLEETPLQALDHGQYKWESVPVLLEQSFKQVSETAQQALAIAGLLSMDPFPPEVVAAALDLSTTKARQLMGELMKYGLLKRTNQEYVVTHALIHTYGNELGVSSQVLIKMAGYYTSQAKQNRLKPLWTEHLNPATPYLEVNYGETFVSEVRYGLLEQTDQGYVVNINSTLPHPYGHELDAAPLLLGKVGKYYTSLYKQNWLKPFHIEYRNAARILVRCIERGKSEPAKFSDPTWKLSCAISFHTLVRLGNACHFMEEAIRHYEQALATARETNDWHSEAGYLFYLGNAYHDLEQVEQAIEYYQQGLAVFHDITDREDKLLFCYLLGCLAIAYRDLGQAEQAIEYQQQAVTIAHEASYQELDYNMLTWLGRTYQDTGQMEQAIEAYEKVIELNPDYPYIYFNLASVYLKLGQLDEAVRLYRQQVNLQPDSVFNAYVCLGVIAKHQGEEAAAKKHFEKAVSVCETASQEKPQTDAALLRGKALAQLGLGQTQQAIKTLKQSLTQWLLEDTIGFTLYDLFATAPQPPPGLTEMRRLLTDFEEQHLKNDKLSNNSNVVTIFGKDYIVK